MNVAADQSRASIFFVSLPKSGTIFTWNSLQRATGLKIPEFHNMEGWSEYTRGLDFACPELYACGDYNTQLLRPENMHHFMRGCIFGGHMQASYHNMRVVKEAGIDRVTVLLRDPRDALVSWVYHLGSLGPSARDYHSKIYHIPRAYYDWPLARQFEYQIRSFLPVVVNWVEGWLDYYTAPEREVEVQFVYYDELKRTPERYIRRFAEFHGICNPDCSSLEKPEPGKLHFRRGEHEQWRQEFSETDRRIADDLMQDRLISGFQAAAASDQGVREAINSIQGGRPAAAAGAALKTIVQFPNERAAYDLLLEGAAASGIDTQELRSEVEATVQNRSVAGQFIYHTELVDACAALSARLGELGREGVAPEAT